MPAKLGCKSGCVGRKLYLGCEGDDVHLELPVAVLNQLSQEAAEIVNDDTSVNKDYVTLFSAQF